MQGRFPPGGTHAGQLTRQGGVATGSVLRHGFLDVATRAESDAGDPLPLKVVALAAVAAANLSNVPREERALAAHAGTPAHMPYDAPGDRIEDGFASRVVIKGP